MQNAAQRLAEWERRYRAGETGWERGSLHPAFNAWIAAEAVPSGRVLIPGAGRCGEVVELAKRGFAVTAVDIAPTPIRAAREATERAGVAAELIQADLLAWEPTEAYDAIYEQTCICALHPDHWEAYAARLTRWLKPGGSLLALFMQRGGKGENGPPYHCDLERMRGVFGAGWEWPDPPYPAYSHSQGLEERAVILHRSP